MFSSRTTGMSVAALLLAAACSSGQSINLNYNFNGLVHTGEQGIPDDLNGFRSISDRSLLIDGLTGSLGTSAITGTNGIAYTINTTPFTLDIVHLGNRTVNFPYEAAAPGTNANVGIQPTWDASPNHTTPQVSNISAQNIQLFANSEIGVLYMISNGGGQFDVTLTFTDSSTVTCRLAGPDWFGTPAVPARLAGVSIQSRLGGTAQLWNSTNNNDAGGTAPTAQRLSVIEGVISVPQMITAGLGNHAGKTIQSITFGNATYSTATPGSGRGYAILAASHRGAAVFPPTASGAATPSTVAEGGTTKLTVTVTPGSAPSGITSVSVNTTAFGGTTASLNDSGVFGDVTAGDNIWSADVTLGTGLVGGLTNLPFTVTDVQSRTATGNIPVTIVAPPPATDLGTITGTAGVSGIAIAPGQFFWYKFTLAAPVQATAGEFLDIDTEGSVTTGGTLPNDTFIGLYDANGNRIATDDDDGSNANSQLTFGATTPARPAPSDGLNYNGRDGATLAAGTYYLCVSAFNTTFAATGWGVTTTHTNTGTYNLNIKRGNTPAPSGPPAVFTDIGNLTPSSTFSYTNTASLDSPGEVRWYRFTLSADVNGANPTRTFLDIDTEGSTGIANTLIGLFRADGTVVTNDNDDGSAQFSQLSFGRGTRPGFFDGLAYNGRDGTLVAGTYYLAVTEYNAAFAPGFVVAYGSGASVGSFNLNLRTGVQSPIIAGPINNPANNSNYFLLETGFTWTDAEAYAVTLGGHLASIDDAAENEFVRANVLAFDGTANRRAWIGYTDKDIEGVFAWSNGSTSTYTNWGAGEPNDANANEDYAEMLGSTGTWNDLSNAGASTGDNAVVEIPAAPACRADFNGVGGLTVQDIFDFLNAWFAGDPSADFSGGGVSVQDIFDFLNAWFAGC